MCYLRFGGWRRIKRRVISSNIHDLRWHEQSTRHYIHFSRVVFRESSRSGSAEWLQTDLIPKTRGRAQLPDRTTIISFSFLSSSIFFALLYTVLTTRIAIERHFVSLAESFDRDIQARCRYLDDLLDF